MKNINKKKYRELTKWFDRYGKALNKLENILYGQTDNDLWREMESHYVSFVDTYNEIVYEMGEGDYDYE